MTIFYSRFPDMSDLDEPTTSLIFDVEDDDGFRIKLENLDASKPLSVFRVEAWHGDQLLGVRIGDEFAEEACRTALWAIREAGATVGETWDAVRRRAKSIDWARAEVTRPRRMEMN